MTQGTPATWLTRALRTICAFIDRIVYFLIAFVYQLFIQVANATLLSGSTVRTLTARVQLIFGLLLVFRLSVSVINGIINPDTLTDREKGFSEVIKRTIIVLIMFTLIVPVNVSNPTSHYQKNIANHGLLFGTMYEIQNSVLSRNVMFRLVFGGDEGTDSDLNNMSSLSGQANAMAGSIYKSFMSINLADESKGEDDPSNWVCEDDITNSEINYYTKADASVSDVVSLTEEWCQPPEDKKFSNVFKPKALEKGAFKFAFQPLVSTICGVFVLIMFIGFTLDVAIRSIKLAILRLIAPIPIGSYIDPKAQKDGAFASWIRITISTYIDLFIRLLIVYFAIFLVQEISTKGLVIEKVSNNVVLNSLTNVVMFIAIFFFAKQAPRFIMDALGIKGGGLSNMGLSGLLAGAGTLAAGGGLIKALSNSAQATSDAGVAAAEGKGYSPMANAYAGFRDKTIKQRTGDNNRRGGLLGKFDHLSDKAMAAKYGLTEKNLGNAKKNWLAAERKATNSEAIYKQRHDALGFLENSMNSAKNNYEGMFASDASRNAYQNFDAQLYKSLSDQKHNDQSELRNLAKTYGENSNEYINATKAYSAKWRGKAAQAQLLNKQASYANTIMAEQGLSNNSELQTFISDAKTKENIYASATQDYNSGYAEAIQAFNYYEQDKQEAADLKRNYEEGKEAYGTHVGKEYAYKSSNKFTPTKGNASQSGSGGTQYSQLGVNSPGGAGGNPPPPRP